MAPNLFQTAGPLVKLRPSKHQPHFTSCHCTSNSHSECSLLQRKTSSRDDQQNLLEDDILLRDRDIEAGDHRGTKRYGLGALIQVIIKIIVEAAEGLREAVEDYYEAAEYFFEAAADSCEATVYETAEDFYEALAYYTAELAIMDTPSPHPDMNRNRLPTLFEVLSRQTLAPVDLFSFYIYMRDQQRSVDYLDFWLDVSQHMSLCRHYVRELRRSVLVETPDLEKQGSKRSSYILDHMGDMNDPSGPSTNLTSDEKMKDQQLSAYLRQENGNNGHNGHNGHNGGNGGLQHSPHSSLGSNISGLRGSGDRPSNGTERPRPSYTTNDSPGQMSESPAHTVARADIRASAEKILYTYLLPGSEREIILPQGILTDITTSIEEEGRDDPEVFDAAKDYTFQAMERDAFPGFLRAKALGNLVPPSTFLRLIIGLLAIFGAFWAGFACIFLDRPKHIRCWLILPFTVGVYSLSSQQYSIDPVLALIGLSENTFMSWSRIREPYIRKLLNKRALMVLFFTVLIGVCLIVLFIFVPGHRL